MVTDERDVPEFWFYDSASFARYAQDRRSTWCYERCLSDDNRVMSWEIFNPVPWPYEDCANCEPGLETSRLQYSDQAGTQLLRTAELVSASSLGAEYCEPIFEELSPQREPVNRICLEAIAEDEHEGDDGGL